MKSCPSHLVLGLTWIITAWVKYWGLANFFYCIGPWVKQDIFDRPTKYVEDYLLWHCNGVQWYFRHSFWLPTLLTNLLSIMAAFVGRKNITVPQYVKKPLTLRNPVEQVTSMKPSVKNKIVIEDMCGRCHETFSQLNLQLCSSIYPLFLTLYRALLVRASRVLPLLSTAHPVLTDCPKGNASIDRRLHQPHRRS